MQMAGDTQEVTEERATTVIIDATGTAHGESVASSTPTAVSSVAIGAMTEMDPSLYIPQDPPPPSRREAFVDAEGDESISIIEEGEHVSAEDFGLSSTDISMSAAISMNVGVELNGMHQIAAFLARPSAELTDAQPSPRLSTATPSDHEAMEVVEPSEVRAVADEPTYPTRVDSKVVQLQTHPLVHSVSVDGCAVLCKCGRSVRLNPPWYILKFEQHIVSRNCTFLRKKKSKRDQAADDKQAIIQAAHLISGKAFGGDMETTSAQEVAADGLSHSSDANRSGNRESEGYALQPLCTLLRMFGVGDASSPFPSTAATRLQSAASGSHSADDSAKIPQTLQQLTTNVYFSRLTPDGRFLECKCSELIILSVPWNLAEFERHVLNKNNPPKPPRRKSFTTYSGSRKPRLGDGAAFRLEQRLLQRETRWLPVTTQVTLPCPGLRDERVVAFIGATSKITGGSRARRRIAEELFPHHFPATTTSDKRSRPKLTPEEKLMLLDAVESEALWFVDHDANAIRSLDCRGMISVHKGERCCSSCEELQSNTSLRVSISVAVGHNKRVPEAAAESNAITAATKMLAACKFTLMEQEFDMTEESSRLLRDLFRAEVEECSVKNMWFDMAQLGMTGCFTSHPAFLGLAESMMMLKEKQRRGVGMQNMLYNDHLDSFMKSLSDISSEACNFFQQFLGGRKQKNLLVKKRKSGGISASSRGNPSDVSGDRSGDPTTGENGDGLVHLLDLSAGSAATMHNLSEADIHGVELASFQHEQGDGEQQSECAIEHATEDNEETDAFLTDGNLTGAASGDSDHDSSSDSRAATLPPQMVLNLPGFMPCKGLRDERVQAYVTSAAQIIGGSRPKYVIAKELFPEAFDGSRTIKIQEKLTEGQKLIVLDAIFSECLWRVDRVGNCVRSLRCFRRVDKRHGKGVCRACLELKSVANFRSVLCRAKIPKNVENLKYVPSVYTESDPFMRKLSKNASLRLLYQTVKAVAPEDKKRATFWLRLAKMGLFGHFRSHAVFEGLVASMVELKDREQRGVGKQNMLYARSLDLFMGELATISMDAFELFTHHFCGRTMRSQKVKKRKVTAEAYDATFQAAMVVNSMAMASAAVAPATHLPSSSAMAVPPPATTASQTTAVADQRAIMMPEELMSATSRPLSTISTAELEESQRFMDRMLDEVRMSTEMHLPEEGDRELDPQTYLDENGVLTTVL